jgi:hypothetical protein
MAPAPRRGLAGPIHLEARRRLSEDRLRVVPRGCKPKHDSPRRVDDQILRRSVAPGKRAAASAAAGRARNLTPVVALAAPASRGTVAWPAHGFASCPAPRHRGPPLCEHPAEKPCRKPCRELSRAGRSWLRAQRPR